MEDNINKIYNPNDGHDNIYAAMDVINSIKFDTLAVADHACILSRPYYEFKMKHMTLLHICYIYQSKYGVFSRKEISKGIHSRKEHRKVMLPFLFLLKKGYLVKATRMRLNRQRSYRSVDFMEVTKQGVELLLRYYAQVDSLLRMYNPVHRHYDIRRRTFRINKRAKSFRKGKKNIAFELLYVTADKKYSIVVEYGKVLDSETNVYRREFVYYYAINTGESWVRGRRITKKYDGNPTIDKIKLLKRMIFYYRTLGAHTIVTEQDIRNVRIPSGKHFVQGEYES